MSDSCGRCQQEIQDDYSYCKTCKSKYHFQCNTVSESSWRSMGPERKAQWKCASCRDKEKERKMINTPEQQVRSSDSETTLKSLENFMSSQFANMNKKMDEKFSDFEASLNFYGDKFDEMSKTMKSLEQKVVLLENQLKQSETENKELKKRVRNMEVQLNMMDQRQNNNKMEITGIKDKEVNEKELMMKIMEKVQPAPESNVQYRVEKIVKPGKDNRPNTTTLVVHFNNQVNRNGVITKIKKEKLYLNFGDILRNNDSSPIFINEYLCPYYRRLYYEANRLKKDKKIAFLWVKDGKILMKKTAESKIENLTCMEDLGKI
ncbi:uncharacterized protein LOC108254163 [Diaphorina citri]|uniref:Uncharacterized protein LOC108254163 n=1 Tax=Diaphorina citri TaxID=121845 RepID=A0A1S4ER08_DIACI|nr:uncharacterized protein LOC108254163 [Diaphorina citri]KAI5734679.1 hypothetical protein M8J77_009420 [Diaphorina citri]